WRRGSPTRARSFPSPGARPCAPFVGRDFPAGLALRAPGSPSKPPEPACRLSETVSRQDAPKFDGRRRCPRR
ncbi:MAG: hypothetical protein AVDCRST_MAG19-2779, partial [uncultured Thermomicrobiales bacterium]